MPQTDTRSLQQIKRETEQTRAGLTDTAEQLRTSVADTATDIRQRIRPEAIKAEVSGYIKSRGEQLLNDVTAAARRNPMQAVAVGASVAYPLLRLVRTIPAPILMIGAGLFLAGSKTGQAATQKASEAVSDLSDAVGRPAGDFGNQVGESASAAKTYRTDQLGRVSAAISGGADQVSRAADAAGATLASTSQQLQEKAASFGASVSNRATEVRDEGTSGGQRATGTTADAGLDAARAVRDKASDLTERAGKTIFETIEQHPLLVAGAGLLVGGLIASALPRSDVEDDLVGDASTAVKRRVQTAASQGFDTAKNAVAEVVDEATRQAQEEGLTPDGLDKAAQDIGQRVRRVAEAAVTTAFEPPQGDHQPSTHGGTDHG
jgi:hypothetical protein